MEIEAQPDSAVMATELVAAYVSNNSLSPAELGTLLVQVHTALAGLSSPMVEVVQQHEKATSAQVKKSITPDALISFIDGKPYKTLKRHLGTHGLDFDSYRARYGLPGDYPTVAAGYSAARSALAKSLGLGQQRRKAAEPTEAAQVVAKSKRASRSRKVAEPA